MKIRLTAKTRKGENVIRNQGSEWTVLSVSGNVAFSSNRGEWLLIGNGSTLKESTQLRWIHKTDDDNFTWEEV